MRKTRGSRHRPLSQVARVLFSLCSFNTSPLYYLRAWHRLKCLRHRLSYGATIQMKHDSLRKQPSFLAPCHLGCFARRDVCASATEIPYWWRNSIRNLPRSSIYCFSYCLRKTDKRQTVTWVNAMDLLQYRPFSWNIFFFGRGIWVLLELVRRRKQNFTIIDQERHKIEQINIWSPLTTGFIMQTLIYVISMVFLSLMRGLPLWRNVPSEGERRGTAIFAG